MDNNFKQKIVEEIVNSKKINWEESIKELIHDEIERAVNSILKNELTAFLGFEKNEQGKACERGDSRNGSFKRELNTTYGPIHVEVPRDRNSEFRTKLFEPYKRSTESIADTVIKLYKANMTDSQIQEIIDSLYRHKYSKSTISIMTDAIEEDVKNFHNRKIDEEYFAIFLDATYVPLRRNTVEKESINIVMGIDMKGYPEILDFSITPEESKDSWKDLLEGLNKRGLKKAKILISDGFVGIDELMKTYLPGCLQQRCYIHIVRNLMNKVRKEDQGLIANQFMELANQESLEIALNKFEKFVEYWASKYKSIRKWKEQINVSTLFNFYHFPKELRKSIYTNNRIEGFNKEIKRNAKTHISWCKEEAEEKFLVTIFNKYNFGHRNRIRGYELIEK